jgi:hypothetical protein
MVFSSLPIQQTNAQRTPIQRYHYLTIVIGQCCSNNSRKFHSPNIDRRLGATNILWLHVNNSESVEHSRLISCRLLAQSHYLKKLRRPYLFKEALNVTNSILTSQISSWLENRFCCRLSEAGKEGWLAVRPSAASSGCLTGDFTSPHVEIRLDPGELVSRREACI